ncbi:DNA-3-methyladenine glycosylase I [Enterococcus sp. DIV0660C]|uniref:DNA-3-methyladenine glycosylase I n=1 Tax=Enterococcus sp. DIV0660C TaxID=2230880 RepID=UPI001A8CB339|nr:DNA-3-methyladenine glycosylase I [Enterococcus sp. DIV0660C]MBO0432077.1 DNA-3-methyladenine glycosylase I [Enterococcus sp. DIV0660C]
MKRCSWAESTASMQQYHDTIWGVPEYDDQRLYRKLMLDINQAGLSWQTILNKIEAFDHAYDNFSLEKVAAYDENKIESLLQDKGIIRNRRKVEAAIHNAKAVQKIQQEFGSFATFLWGFSDDKVVNHMYQTQEEIPTTSELSDKITKELKKRGFKFIGSTTIYAFLEAVGIINDHVTDCFRHLEVKQSTIQEN